MDYSKLADLLFPNITQTPKYYLDLYPRRNRGNGELTTRYAPSPTGFQHLGGVFTSLIDERLAHQSNGTFYLRVEDTDKKREVAYAVDDIVNTLNGFDIIFDEGMINSSEEKGGYGPYRQSDRVIIYQTFVKALIQRGLAYPCFCSEDDLDKIREKQQNLKINFGYYKNWAKCRNLSFEDVKKLFSNGSSYVVRLKSPGDSTKKILCKDLIRGEISMPENDQDIVLLKSDGVPTYHLAHAIDDFLMDTTTVVRGEEWLPSLPIHLQLFDILNFTPPDYAHIPTIMKMDGTSKRKLSKRKDPEISIDYYRSQGYPFIAIIEYLINLINSDFQDFRREHPFENYKSFKIRLDKMNQSGALFDLAKLIDVSKTIISQMTAYTVFEQYKAWTQVFDTEMAHYIDIYPEYVLKIFNIERDQPKPRKDICKWLEVRDYISYYFDDLFREITSNGYDIPERLSPNECKGVISKYLEIYSFSDDKDMWFSKIKQICDVLNYAADNKSYKKNPDQYKGNITDVTMIIRLALTNKTNTPDLYEIMNVMGEKRVLERLQLLNSKL